MEFINQLLSDFSSLAWGLPLLILLIGGGLYLLVRSHFVPFRYLGHALNVLRGKYDDPNDPGEISHFQALTTALSATVGMGNIAGVAVAISVGGPGAVFWMWISAVVGMSTKFFTSTLASELIIFSNIITDLTYCLYYNDTFYIDMQKKYYVS